jgi:8-oxo-dGTP diphosphatase
MLGVDWAPNGNEGDKLLFLFDCGALGEDEQRIKLDGCELDGWRWVDLADLDEFVISRISRRIRSVGTLGNSYLEHGDAGLG